MVKGKMPLFNKISPNLYSIFNIIINLPPIPPTLLIACGHLATHIHQNCDTLSRSYRHFSFLFSYLYGIITFVTYTHCQVTL